MLKQYIYFFGKNRTEGSQSSKNLLGGKGANLAEMTNLGIPVPPGFTISTDVCSYYYKNNNTYPNTLKQELEKNLSQLEKTLNKKLGDPENPLLVSVRSGAPISMPGMMDTVLNLGLNDNSVQGLATKTGNAQFAYDSYRRFIQMLGNVVFEIEHHDFESILTYIKNKYKIEHDYELAVDHLKEVIQQYKELFQQKTNQSFPQDPKQQLQLAIDAVFNSWMNERAIYYRKMHKISDSLGTAVNIQSMVFGNMGNTSGTGVAFTRNPSNGNKEFYGEFLFNAQGEDVVAGIRTPLKIKELENKFPTIYKELFNIAEKLEKHYKDMQDIEFTIENKVLFILQTRNGKRTSFAEVCIAVDLVKEGFINEQEAICRVNPNSIPSLLAHIFDTQEKKEFIQQGKILTEGSPAGPGAATGKIALTAESVLAFKNKQEPSILVRMETSPEDIAGMYSAEGILTAKGGMTSHAAVVARGMNKPCIVGCASLNIDNSKKEITISTPKTDIILKEGDSISIDGFTGEVILGTLKTIQSDIERYIIHKNKDSNSKLVQSYKQLIKWAKDNTYLSVRCNSDTGMDANVARLYGAEGIGLCRTEHMFFGENRILAMRKMILAENSQERKSILQKEILNFQKEDFKKIFKVMHDLPVTIRLLDPPLHEFLPHISDTESIEELSRALQKDTASIKHKIEHLKEANPMLGHRGCRLGITYPEITEIQVQAIIEAACELKQNNIDVLPEIMVPLVGHYKELAHQSIIIKKVAEETMKKYNTQINYLLGTMIEVPRAAITADEIAEHAQFFSFGTNDLTQMGAGFSRDDGQSFLPYYSEIGIYKDNPFVTLDTTGVGKFIQLAIEKGKAKNKNLKLGVCGEHGGDSSSIEFCHNNKLNYVSCSPYRVPIAILSASQAYIKSIQS